MRARFQVDARLLLTVRAGLLYQTTVASHDSQANPPASQRGQQRPNQSQTIRQIIEAGNSKRYSGSTQRVHKAQPQSAEDGMSRWVKRRIDIRADDQKRRNSNG